MKLSNETTPLETVADAMILQLDDQIKRAKELSTTLESLRPYLEAFESGSAEIWQGRPWIHLHRPTSVEAAKAFCRAWGGEWNHFNDGKNVKYQRSDSTCGVTIHDVETFVAQPLAL